MKVLTWNIFFDTDKIVERTKKIIEISISTNSDIILFQEVRKSILDMMISLMNNGGYHIPCSDLQTKRVIYYGYSTLAFFKTCHQNVDINIIKYNLTYMDRDIMQISSNDITIYNVHLESMNTKQFRDIRLQQLDLLLNLVKNKLSVACGDFNINENIVHNDILTLPLKNTYFRHRFHNETTFEASYDKIIYNKNNIRECKLIGYVGDILYEFGYCSDHNGILFSC